VSQPTDQPLHGITVVDLSQIYNGPYATFLLAMAGADVIKVEPRNGEHLRRRGVVGGAALPFAMLNANKRSVSLDLKTDKGKKLLIELAKKADVLVENFAPGVMDRLGLGADVLHEVNPRLVYAQSSRASPTARRSRPGRRFAISLPACTFTAASSRRSPRASARGVAGRSRWR
jgi:CoA:oxalate CoA-transferase